PQRVLDRRSLAQEFRIRYDVERYRPLLMTFDHLAHQFTGADGHRRFVDDDRVSVHGAPDRACNRFDSAQIGPAVDFWRCADRDEDDDRFPDGRREIRGEREAPVADIARHHLLQTRLVDGHVPRLEGGDLVSDVVNAHDLVSEIGEDGAGYETDVPG